MSGSIKKENTIILIVLAVAFLLRVWAINWGLPYLYCPDEALMVNHALKMGSGNLDPEFYGYGPPFMYVLATLYGIYFLISYASGFVNSPDDFAIAFFRDPSNIYLISRGVSVIVGTLTILFVYLIGKKLYNSKVGVIAAVFMTFSPLAVQYSHLAKMDSFLTLFFAISLYIILIMWEKKSLKYYLWAGLFCGFTMAIKFPAVMIGIPFLTAHIFVCAEEKLNIKQTILNNNLIVSLFAIIAGYFLVNPYMLLNFGKFMSQIMFARALYTDPHSGVALGISYWYLALRNSLGTLICISTLFGIFYLIYTRKKRVIWIALTIFSFWLPVGISATKFAQWILPIFPLLVICSGKLLNDLVSIFTKSPLFRRYHLIAVLFVIVLFIIAPAASSIKYLSKISKKDTRTLAIEWIEKNIPPNSKVLMDRGKYMSADNAPLRQNYQNLTEAYLNSKQPHKSGNVKELTFSQLSKYYEYKIRSLEGITYDIVPIFHGTLAEKGHPFVRDNLRSIEEYKKNGIEYIIISSSYYNNYTRYILNAEKAGNNIPEYIMKYYNFYKLLENETNLMKEFKPNGRPGPTIKVYRMK